MFRKTDELKLVARCVLFDDREAFGQLVEAYQSEIRRFFCNLTCGDIALSDDLAQETFIKAYLNIRNFKGMARFRTWLYRIAYNEYYSELRKRREAACGDDGLPDRLSDENLEASAGARMDVTRALQQLSGIERTVTVLFYINDKPLKEIAAITGLPEGTVKSHLSRAKGKMARFFVAN